MNKPDHICLAQFAFASVTAKGFDDVSILSAGEAKGHGIMVDERTIEQFIAATLGKTVPAYLTHEDAGLDRLGGEIGMFSGFYRDGLKVRANFRFLQSFIDNEKDEYATLTELAKTYPDQLGISPVIQVSMVWPMPDGSEVSTAEVPEKPEECAAAMPSMRILGVRSCDFVKSPAANVGLFSAKEPAIVDQKPLGNLEPMPTDTILLTDHTAALAVKDGEIAALAAKHTEALTALEAKLTEATAEKAELAGAIGKASAKVTELETALTAKTAECAAALEYDMRKAGAPQLEAALTERATSKLPAPAAKDKDRWHQYAELEATDITAAELFKSKFLSRK